MRQARYEIVEDDASFYGEIPAISGVRANAKSLGACREELESVLEGDKAPYCQRCERKPPPIIAYPRSSTTQKAFSLVDSECWGFRLPARAISDAPCPPLV